MSEKTESKEIVVENINQVALNRGEKARIVISESEDGQVTISAKTEGPMGITYLVGLLEIAKNDVMNRQSEEQPDMAVTEITLTEIDFEMDTQGSLKAQGKVVGDIVKMPKAIADLRESAIIQFKRTKELVQSTK